MQSEREFRRSQELEDERYYFGNRREPDDLEPIRGAVNGALGGALLWLAIIVIACVIGWHL